MRESFRVWSGRFVGICVLLLSIVTIAFPTVDTQSFFSKSFQFLIAVAHGMNLGRGLYLLSRVSLNVLVCGMKRQLHSQIEIQRSCDSNSFLQKEVPDGFFAVDGLLPRHRPPGESDTKGGRGEALALKGLALCGA